MSNTPSSSIILVFEQAPPFDGHPSWRVISRDNKQMLGAIKWYGHHSLFHFHPEPGVSFGKVRLFDLSRFLKDHTNEERQKLNKSSIAPWR